MASDQNFQVDLGGIIELLSDHLYSGPEVYLRELIQNAVDALSARKGIDISFVSEDNPIQIEVIDGKASDEPPTLVITDHGIGLTESEIHEFLATIGQSSKRTMNRENFIGQFGIGLLSGFIVSDEIVVISQSVKEGNPALEWRGRSDGTYSLRKLDHDAQVGTQVFLRPKRECYRFVEPDFVLSLAKRFASHLSIPIDVVASDETQRVNVTPPWEYDQSDPNYVQRCLDYGAENFGQPFIGVIPFESKSGGVEGVAFITAHASRHRSQRQNSVYLKGMLLSETVDNMMPEWAFFVTSVSNATRLRPTANREGFHQDTTLSETQFEIAVCLKRYLVDLSKNDRESLERIIALHHLAIKGLAVEDDEFFDLISDWLPFQTSLGTMLLGDYREHQKAVRYVRNQDEFRQIVGVAAAQKICIIDAGYTHDEALLERFSKRNPHVMVERLEISELAQEFGELSVAERNSTFEFLRFAEAVLEPFECSVQLKRFQPAMLPALYTHNSQAGFMRAVDQAREVSDEMWDSVLSGVSSNKQSSSKAQLCLNFDNSLVQRLSKVDDQGLLGEAIKMLYVQSLLLGHYPLRAKETDVLSGGLIHLIDAALGK